MKQKQLEKTKKITVVALLISIGIGAVAGISLCLYKEEDRPIQSTASAKEPEDIIEIPDETTFMSRETAEKDTDDVQTSLEIPANNETFDSSVQAIQDDPVKTENTKPNEPPEEAQEQEGMELDDQTSQPEEKVIPAENDQQKETSPVNNTDNNSQHGNIQNGKIFIDGFGWIEYNGGQTVGNTANDVFENGNKVGIMD